RVLLRYPEARLTGIDVSEEMLAAARRALPPESVDQLLVQEMQDPLPEGPFDLVISALTIHHLDASGKADLFQRLARVVRRGGRFVMADVIVPTDPKDALTPLSPDYDMPSPINDLLRWLREAGFDPRIVWSFKDLAVISSNLV
ncbi:MAG: class I SAM-dependent methyltransferase, partial [Actinomycetota bacterium]